MAASRSRITLLVDGRPVTVDETGTIAQLYEEVARVKSASTDSFYLVYAGQPLDLARDGGKKVKEYHFCNMEALVFTERSHGGSNLRALEGHVQLTKEPCCVTFEDDKDTWRAKLICGHVLSVPAVQRMLKVTLKDGDYEFHCPSCSVLMQWTVVRHILSSAMSDSELRKSLDTINDNYRKRKLEIRQCTVCKTHQARDFTKKWYDDRNWVVCNECSRRAGHEVSYCWHCRQPWRSGFKGCGNRNCDGEAAKLMELKECRTKTIGSVSGCPETRACPRCGTLINHIDKCKHMKCRCGCEFCFVCLQLPKSEGRWPCGGANDSCNVAPRQTYIAD